MPTPHHPAWVLTPISWPLSCCFGSCNPLSRQQRGIYLICKLEPGACLLKTLGRHLEESPNSSKACGPHPPSPSVSQDCPSHPATLGSACLGRWAPPRDSVCAVASQGRMPERWPTTPALPNALCCPPRLGRDSAPSLGGSLSGKGRVGTCPTLDWVQRMN